MAQYVLSDFRRGVDTQRPPFARPEGALTEGLNVHLTPAGDIEKRKAFVEAATLPAGCYGMLGIDDDLYTFGSVSPPAMPTGFTYQQLTDPTGLGMTEVVDVEAFDGEAFVIAKYGDMTRTFENATRVKDLDPDVCRFRLSVTAGTSNPGTNKVNSITVGGVDILGAAVDWATSHVATAAAIAAQINSHASVPNYTAQAYSDMAEVVITSPHGTISTGAAVAVSVGGDVVLTPSSGTMEAPIAAPTSARTLGQKVYATSGPYVRFSAVLDASNFSPNSTGGGFFNSSTHSSGATTLSSLELFYSDLVVFGARESQRWYVESDDSQNEMLQVFRGAGAVGARASHCYLDGPTFFVDRPGVRVVQTRDSSGRSMARGDSDAINRDLKADLDALTSAQRARVLMFAEPEDDRLWVVVGSKVYVRSWFPGWNDPAWTTYEPGFNIVDYAVADNKLYLLADTRKVYIYGGPTGESYDNSTARVRFAHINARAPANLKGLQAADFGVEGAWTVSMSLDPNDVDFSEKETVAAIGGYTFDSPQYPLAGQSTTVSLEFVNTTAERAVLSSVILHYKTDDAG